MIGKEDNVIYVINFQPIPIESNICQKVRIKLVQWMFIPISLHKSFYWVLIRNCWGENQQNFNDLHIIKFYIEEIIEIALNRYQLILSGKWQGEKLLSTAFPGDFKVNFYTWLVVVIGRDFQFGICYLLDFFVFLKLEIFL